MRLMLAAMLGIAPDDGYGWRFAACQVSGTPLTLAVTGGILYRLGRLLYRRD